MAKQSKATKKFEKTKLKGTLERRKDFAKVKQRHKQNEKRKQKTGQDDEAESGNEEAITRQPPNVMTEDMDHDDFFQESVSITKTDGGHGNSKKRKRNADDTQSTREASIDAEASAATDQEEDEDEEDHQGQLKALAEKDPEFYKFLQQNDADLLEFSEDEEGPNKDDERPGKKQKRSADGGAIDVTTDMVKKWKSAMIELHSISALKNTVSAFKTAATSEHEDAKASRYSIPTSAVYHEVLVTALDGVPKVPVIPFACQGDCRWEGTITNGLS